MLALHSDSDICRHHCAIGWDIFDFFSVSDANLIVKLSRTLLSVIEYKFSSLDEGNYIY